MLASVHPLAKSGQRRTPVHTAKRPEPWHLAWLRSHMRHHVIDAMRLGEEALASPYSISNWLRKGSDPSISSYEAVLNTLGYRLKIVPMEETT